MAIAVALMKVVGDGFQLFARVESQGVTEADAASGVPGDVMCYDANDKVVFAVEVKDRNITLADVRASTRQVRLRDEPLTNFLFAAPGIQRSEQEAIDDTVEQAWGSGLNLYRLNLLDFAASCFALLDEGFRPAFLREVGVDLDRRGDHRHRRAWHDLLANIGGEDTR